MLGNYNQHTYNQRKGLGPTYIKACTAMGEGLRTMMKC